MEIKDKWVFVILFVLVFLLKYPTLSLPYHWDELNSVVPAALHSYNYNFTPFVWEEGFGHPPLLYLILAFGYFLFGHSQFVTHVIIALFSFLTVFFTFLIGKRLFNPHIGLIAALLLLFTPLFFAQSGIAHLSVPSAALVVMTLYFFIKKETFLYCLLGSLLVLTEERAALLIPAILLMYLINKKKIDKDFLIYSIPLWVFFIWIILTKLHYGWFLYPRHVNALITNPIHLILNVIYILKVIFFDDFKWILTSLIILSGFSFNTLKRRFYNKKILIYLIISLSLFVLFYNSTMLSEYLLPKYPNNIAYLKILKDFSFLFATLFFILLCTWKELLYFYLDKKSMIINLSLLFFIIGYSLFPFNPRYAVPALPLFFLLVARSFNHIFKRRSYLFLIVILFLFVTCWFGQRDSIGFALENNLEYIDFINVNQEAAKYIEENYKDKVILSSIPISLSLEHPYGGYVNESLDVREINPVPISPIGDFASIKNASILWKDINLSDIDIVVYSNQAYHSKPVNDALNTLDLKLVKTFEKNNKKIYIYEVKNG